MSEMCATKKSKNMTMSLAATPEPIETREDIGKLSHLQSLALGPTQRDIVQVFKMEAGDGEGGGGVGLLKHSNLESRKVKPICDAVTS